VVLNVSSDAAVTPYAGWGAYGASKAALAHLSRIWDEELGARHRASSPSIRATWTRRCTPSPCPTPIRRR
jgi:NAD(P)-dependent dehydrogenase (short-subunit alcohol dehydrogenase family)